LSTHEAFQAARRKDRLLFLADIISLFSPMSLRELVDLLRAIYNTEEHLSIDIELGLLVALRLIVKRDEFYWRSLDERGLFFDFVGINEVKVRCQVVNYLSKYHRARTFYLLPTA
jgi:hypothetical protein